MRGLLLWSALSAVAVAAPRPQDIDFSAIDDAAEPTVTGPPIDALTQAAPTDLASSAMADAAQPSDSSLRRRGVNDPCGVQPAGSGPVPSPDTPDAFLNFKPLQTTAVAASTPPGYQNVFSDLKASVNGNIYMGLNTITSYDPSACAALCDAAQGCQGFNLYFERDPTLNPADGCPNPPSLTNIKCTLWGAGVTPAMAVNTGQNRDQFVVVISGSNGYNKNTAPPAIPGYDGPTALGGAINAPLDNGVNTYLGVKFFVAPYDPNICATACNAQTAYNRRHADDGKYRPCNFFAAYITSVDGKALGLYCSLYTRAWDPSYATNKGQYRGGKFYANTNAYSYTLDPLDPGTVSGGQGDDHDDGHRNDNDNHQGDNDGHDGHDGDHR